MADQDPYDIRKWLSPKGNTSTPTRRRRVITSGSSDNEQHESQNTTAIQDSDATITSAQQPIAMATTNALLPPSPATPIPPPSVAKPEATPQHVDDIIQLSSSEDSMYIHRSCARPTSGGAAATPRRPASQQHRCSSKSQQPRRNSKRERARCGTKNSKTKKFTAEAEEVSTDHDSECETCDESEPNAQDLYHEAIMGVRRANHARSQLRNTTINCPVCTKFAAFLQHFTT